ncbi:hypothetical protein P3R38_00840 [Pseudomonas sp. NyZ480]|uniref:hypothetical protein n=1 Tax=Pseudomonas sp. NyZ480 TaxID=3035289 RepID=UPI001F1B2235|nr:MULTISPECIES: hypothetical protein [Pseudomonas]WEZ88855.1 hypothetical protein P3R38_00840 [Pseudomonas sp. NyZ480]
MPSPQDILPPDHQAYTDAVEAMRLYYEAKAAGLPEQAVERLRLIAEAQFQALSDYQLSAWGMQSKPVH